MKKFGNVLWGLVFILIGIIVGLNATGLTDINLFFDGWWTLFIIIPSFISLFKDENKTWSIIGLVIGIVLFLCVKGIFSFEIIGKLIFPFILVMIGLNILFKDAFQAKLNSEIEKLNNNGSLNEYCATFSSIKNSLKGQEFTGANIDAIFGSVKLDLSESTVSHDQIINANAVFGGVELFMPKNVNIKVKSIPLFGGTSYEKYRNVYSENLPTLYVNSFCLFGGVDLK